jgi:hypothetical protein
MQKDERMPRSRLALEPASRLSEDDTARQNGKTKTQSHLFFTGLFDDGYGISV